MKKRLAILKNKTVQKILIGLVAVILIITGYIFYDTTRNRVFIDDALLSAPVITISPENAGRLTQMDVTEGQTVKKGDTLAVVEGQTLHADTDGLIIFAPDQSGSSVNTQTQLIEMINPVHLRVAGTIDENKGLNSIRIGQVVSFTLDAFPGKTYWGYVDEISPSAKQTQLSFSISSERPTQQFIVYAQFAHAKYPEIRNGMSAKMVVYTATY